MTGVQTCALPILLCCIFRLYKYAKYKSREFDEYDKHKVFLKRISPEYRCELFNCCSFVCNSIMIMLLICSFVLAIMLIKHNSIMRKCVPEIATVRIENNLDSLTNNVTSRIDSISVRLNSNFEKLNKTIQSTNAKYNKSNDITYLHLNSVKQVIHEN